MGEKTAFEGPQREPLTNDSDANQVADISAAAAEPETETGPKSTSAQKVPKKRTKTGCLTCRQRRIKCGEEKPICNNCIKSKRECKGYIQRVIFKNPIGIFGAYNANQALNAPMQPTSSGAPLPTGYYNQELSQLRQAGSNRPLLAPRPFPLAATGPSTFNATGSAGPQETNIDTLQPRPQQYESARLVAVPSAPGTLPYGFPQLQLDIQNHDYLRHGTSAPTYNVVPARDQQFPPQQASAWPEPPVPVMNPQGTSMDPTPAFATAPIPQKFHQAGPATTTAFASGTRQEQQPVHEPTAIPLMTSSKEFIYVDDESEEYYDVESDEEMEEQTSAEDFNQLSLIVASANQDERQLRSFTTYLNEPNMLASYHPTLGSSPLNNPKTARIFVHFIHSTGPSLSIFERHPADSAHTLGSPVPAAQQGLWTHTMPLKALEHQALLQAILALSSLHISYLQQAPPTVSLKHYHYALKRVGHAVGLPQRRKQVGTLAATLLLAYYEVMTAEHSKWNSHVAGSAQLVREIDFATLTRDIRSHRRRVWAQRQRLWEAQSAYAAYYAFDEEFLEDDLFAEKESSIDENFIGSLLGRAVNFDQFGQVEDGRTRQRERHFTRKDIETYRIQCDLYWWYCKQDMIQAFIGGGGLILPFSRWGQCPPRAGIGRLDAVYGSADHLWLLLARLTDFGYRDRKRKLHVARTTGQDWRPGPGLHKFMSRFAKGSATVPRGPPPGSAQNRGPEPNRQSPVDGPSAGRENSPPMYGMVPPRGPTRLPSAFASTAHRSLSPGKDEEGDVMSYEDAESEWEDIRAAFDTFAGALGPDFLPLPADTIPPIATPFGPALQYRTHTVAVLWGFYYAGRILLHRLHPSMPPAMMVAAGVAAPTTADYAQIIGKVAAGIYFPQWFNVEAGKLSPTLGACLIEMTVPIFFAAVQFVDAAQRSWTISKLRDVSRLTGWKSSEAIALGCENAWAVAAKQGRGPPYERTQENLRKRPKEDPSPNEGVSEEHHAGVNTERRLVTISKSMHVHWAMGLLSLEDDVLIMETDDRR
ncbi:hypothetical protein KXX16_003589 [Aspergillus fumigatus]|nr:hypothetical protein KXX47_007170 [Aspergillus fumigatus]KAH1347787.1 hypothetical protein KXX14_003813 [Aspergillus fumigatus]KAH1393289.1 hypothetical protein KXX49_001027 [Aspergillus fumigatus]KAH1415636.1 hypothetical protein KXX64_005807 [Aspergillus fumigatus]KAH1451743.1 hypothetical protein KXX58_003819 [Aspergillus fumigatus]